MSDLRRGLDERVARGLIRRATSADGLSVYCYTEACTFDRAWDEFTTQARGLILDSEDNLVARPFPKFFNLGEVSCPPLPSGEYEVFEKLDGSLGIWYYHQGRWRVSTKGSFDNDYTRWATDFAHRLAFFPQDWTVLTEIVLPPALDGMARVVKHEPGVYLLGAINTHSAEDYLLADARTYWPSSQVAKTFTGAKIEQLLVAATQDEGTEGWVARFDNAFRCKIKTAWYLRLFRAVSDLNEKTIRELLLAGGNLSDFPEEFRAEAEVIYNTIVERYATRYAAIEQEFIQHQHHPTRKAFALAVKDYPDKAFLFDLYDRKDITGRLLKIA